MEDNDVHAVIMAGGRGERFWPKSRASFPKQALNLVGRQSMLQDTVNRISPLIPHDKILIITNKEQSGIIKRQLPHKVKDNIIIEPVGRNTAACIGLAALLIEKRQSPESVMLVLPSDHLITKRKSFLKVLSSAFKMARDGNNLVTLGIRPTYPATGYGYIEMEPGHSSKGVYKVKKFIEKPQKRRAERFLKTNRYFWNSGMFIWKVSTILREIEKTLPGLYKGLMDIRKTLGKDGSIKPRRMSAIYTKLDSISIDYGVMEKSDNVFVVKADIGWQDLGSWVSLNRLYRKNRDGNIIIGKHSGIDTNDCIIVSDNGNLIGTVGVKGLIIVRSGDSVLVSSMENGEKVKKLVQGLSKNKALRRFI